MFPELVNPNAAKDLAHALGFDNEADPLSSAAFWGATPEAILGVLQGLMAQEAQKHQLDQRDYAEGLAAQTARKKTRLEGQLGYAQLGSRERVSDKELAAKLATQQLQIGHESGLLGQKQEFEKSVIPAAKEKEIEATKGLKAATLGYQMLQDKRKAEQFQQSEARKGQQHAENLGYKKDTQKRIEQQANWKETAQVMDPTKAYGDKKAAVLLFIRQSPERMAYFDQKVTEVGPDKAVDLVYGMMGMMPK